MLLTQKSKRYVFLAAFGRGVWTPRQDSASGRGKENVPKYILMKYSILEWHCYTLIMGIFNTYFLHLNWCRVIKHCKHLNNNNKKN